MLTTLRRAAVLLAELTVVLMFWVWVLSTVWAAR